jgi:hypothetical protein
MYWDDGTISDIEEAIRDIAILLEPTRVERATKNGKLSLGTQIRWMYRDSQRARDKKDRLLACHSSLMAVLAHLQRVNVPEAIPVHELGTEMSSKSAFCSSLNLQDSVDGFCESKEIRNETTVVGPADLSFQLWSRDKRIHASKHEPIAVNWMPATDFD